MFDLTGSRLAGIVGLVGGLLLVVGPFVFAFHGTGATLAPIIGIAGIVVALKTLVRPAALDAWLLLGTGGIAILAGLAVGAPALWLLVLAGAVFLGAGAWRRISTEPEGGPRISPS
jgi:hypothetical protein